MASQMKKSSTDLVVAIQKGEDAGAAWAALLAHFPELAASYWSALEAAAAAGSVAALSQMAARFIGQPVAYVVGGVEVFRGTLEKVRDGWADVRQASSVQGHPGYVDAVSVRFVRPLEA